MRNSIIVLLIFLQTTCLYAQKFENLAQTPPMGWNSWNRFKENIDEKSIRQIADGMVNSGMAAVGYEYIVLDDYWQIGRDKDGNILADPKKFPSGMKALADYVHSKGLKFGLYSCAGSLTCAGMPGSRGHEYQDARTYASWGVDYLKYDWCYHESLNSESAYKTMLDGLYAAGRPVVFSICEWGSTKPWLWAEKVGHLWRTSPDIEDCFDCSFNMGNIILGWTNILELQVGKENYAGPGHWNDPDMLEVGNGGMTPVEDRSHFTMWCMLAAPLITGNDLRNMTESTLRILTNKDVIAIDQDKLGNQGFRYVKKSNIDIWIKQLSGDRIAVSFLNLNDTPNNFKFDWRKNEIYRHINACNLADLPNLKIHNVWDNKSMGTADFPMEVTIQPHDVVLVILSK